MSILELDRIDRPREKLLARGHVALSDLELLQVIIGSGIKGADVTQLSRDIYELLEQNGGKVSLAELVKIRGVSTATASKLIASLELAGRFVKSGTKIVTVEDVLPLLVDIRHRPQEHFVAITLDGANRVIEKRTIAVGILNASLVHPREVFADAVADRAASVIVAHNHPSGTLEPSMADIEVTRRLQEAGTLLGIPLFDHLVVTGNDHISLSPKV